jgi:hypothetical protein
MQGKSVSIYNKYGFKYENAAKMEQLAEELRNISIIEILHNIRSTIRLVNTRPPSSIFIVDNLAEYKELVNDMKQYTSSTLSKYLADIYIKDCSKYNSTVQLLFNLTMNSRFLVLFYAIRSIKGEYMRTSDICTDWDKNPVKKPIQANKKTKVSEI